MTMWMCIAYLPILLLFFNRYLWELLLHWWRTLPSKALWHELWTYYLRDYNCRNMHKLAKSDEWNCRIAYAISRNMLAIISEPAIEVDTESTSFMWTSNPCFVAKNQIRCCAQQVWCPDVPGSHGGLLEASFQDAAALSVLRQPLGRLYFWYLLET